MVIDPARNYMISKMQSRIVTEEEFDFDRLSTVPLYSLLSPYDIDRLYNIASSIRYAGNVTKKYNAINEILNPKGFIKLASGTNRVAYRHQEIDSIILKTAFNFVGIQDSPKEFQHQKIFKPFVTKVFEVSQDGTVGMFERVKGIVSREEFCSIAKDVFEVISEWFVGDYVLADIGTKYFMNWGYRSGFGPVLLDFPYCYKLDGNKLFCSVENMENPTGHCGGVIDYDDGYNYLYCKKCGAKYKAQELAEAIKTRIIQKTGGKNNMKAAFRKGNKIYVDGVEVTPESLQQKEVKLPQESNIVRSNNASQYTKSKKNNYNNQYNRKDKYEKRYTREEIENMRFKFTNIDKDNLHGVSKDGIIVIVNGIEGNIFTKEDLEERLKSVDANTNNDEQLDQAEIERLNAENDILSKTNYELETKLEQVTGELNDLKISNNVMSEKSYDVQLKLDQSTEEVNRLNSINADLNNKIDDLQIKLKEAMEEINKLNRSIERKDNIVESIIEDSEDLRSEVVKLRRIINSNISFVDVDFPEEDKYKGILDVEGYITTASKLAQSIKLDPEEIKDIEADDKSCIVIRNELSYLVDDYDNLLVVTSINGESLPKFNIDDEEENQ